MYYNIFVFFILGLLSKFYDDYVDINEIKNILFPYSLYEDFDYNAGEKV